MEALRGTIRRLSGDGGTKHPVARFLLVAPDMFQLLKRKRPMATKALEDLFYDMLKDVFYAERKILKTLPKMAKGAQSP
jgi:hypothetical protein